MTDYEEVPHIYIKHIPLSEVERANMNLHIPKASKHKVPNCFFLNDVRKNTEITIIADTFTVLEIIMIVLHLRLIDCQIDEKIYLCLVWITYPKIRICIQVSSLDAQRKRYMTLLVK